MLQQPSMRELLEYINEAAEKDEPKSKPKQKPKPTAVADKEDIDLSSLQGLTDDEFAKQLDTMFGTAEDKQMTTARQTGVSSTTRDDPTTPGIEQTRAQTAATSFALPQDAGQAILPDIEDDYEDIDIPDDELAFAPAHAHAPDNEFEFGAMPVEPEVPQPLFQPNALTRLPGTDVARPPNYEEQGINIHWHKLSHTPGYRISAVRGMFRQFFQHNLDAQLEDMHVATTLDRSTSPADMQQMARYIHAGGKFAKEAEIEMPEVISPRVCKWEIKQYSHSDGYYYFFAKEIWNEGRSPDQYYIYRAPIKDTPKKLGGEWK